MCEFFSFVSDGKGELYYFDYPIRKKVLSGKLKDRNGNSISEIDSHSSITAYFNLDDDKVNKYEYNPITRYFRKDSINLRDDSGICEKKVKKIKFDDIVPELLIKKIFDPIKSKKKRVIGKKEKALLKNWASVGASVGDSVWASIRASVGDSGWDSIGDSVRASVGDSVGASIGDSVRASVGDSVWDSIGDSIRASIRVYMGSFFNLKKWKYLKHKPGVYPYQCCVDLWEAGLVSSYDGTTWRLHGYNAKILYENKGATHGLHKTSKNY